MENAFLDFEFDPRERVLRHAGEIVLLPPKAVDLLEVLLERRGHVVSKDVLMSAVWGDAAVEEGNLTQMVLRLRRALAASAGRVRIENVPRRGYCLTIETPPALPVFRRPHALGKRTALTIVAALAAALAVGLALPAFVARNSGDPALVQRAYTTWFDARGEADVERSIFEFQSALASSPDSAPAHAGYAYALISKAIRESSAVDAAADVRSAFLEARRAVALAPGLADAHAALGQANADFGNAGTARNELREAVSLDRDSVEAQTWYGELLFYEGDARDAAVHLRIAQSQNSTWTEAGDSLALIAYLSRNYGRAVAIASQSLVQAPNDPYALFVRALSEAPACPQCAIGDAGRIARANPHGALGAYALLAYAETKRGDVRRAEADLRRANRIAAREGDVADPLAVLSFAGTFAWRHQPADAFAWLERVPLSQRAEYVGDARLDGLRTSPQFGAWLHGG